MKKLLIVCGALFVIGCSLFAVGRVSGGVLYAPYCDDCHPAHNPLHPFFSFHWHGWRWSRAADEVKELVDDTLDDVGDTIGDALDAARDTVQDALSD